jgi:hypothetical protein
MEPTLVTGKLRDKLVSGAYVNVYGTFTPGSVMVYPFDVWATDQVLPVEFM